MPWGALPSLWHPCGVPRGPSEKIDHLPPTRAPKSVLGCYFGTRRYVVHKYTPIARFPWGKWSIFHKMTKIAHFGPFLVIFDQFDIPQTPVCVWKPQKQHDFFFRKLNLDHVGVHKKIFEIGFWKSTDDGVDSAIFQKKKWTLIIFLDPTENFTPP